MSDLARYVEGLVEGRRGTLVQEKRERRVWRVEEGGLVWYAKRGVGSKRREVRREAENARTLAGNDFGPAVLASGEFGGAAWLVTADAKEDALSLSLQVAFADRATLATVASGVRRLHEAGFSHPHLTGHHVFATRDSVRVIDAAGLERHRGPVPSRARARDLAALLFSFRSRQRLSRTDRVRLVRDATGAAGTELRWMLRRIDAELERLRDQTRWRHGFWRVSDAMVVQLQEGGAGGDGGVGYEDLLRSPLWTVVRTLPDRQNLVMGRDRGGGPVRFAKRYPPVRRGFSPALREVEAAERFQRCGIPVSRIVGYVEDVEEGSLVAVARCRGEPLDDLLRRGVSVVERRGLAVQTARIWRRMRECGLRHRDAYPCHLFAAPWAFPDGTGGATLAGAARFELRLIDLTRAGLAPFPKERWFVKDAAQLWHGLPKPPVTRTDAVRWLREYFRVPKLTRSAKRFARKVAAKERSIAAHVARKARRGRKTT